jgi:hypothetical protein
MPPSAAPADPGRRRRRRPTASVLFLRGKNNRQPAGYGGTEETKMEILENIDMGRLAEIVASMGIEAEAKESQDFIRLPEQDGLFSILKVTHGGEGIRLFIGVSVMEPDRKLVKTWNTRQRCARSYFLSDGGVAMDSDISLKGGVTVDNVKEFVRNGIALAAGWIEEVYNKGSLIGLARRMAKLIAR